jgi:FkbM family methyltransferase
MMSQIRKLSRRALFRSPAGLKLLLRMGKLAQCDYYDCMSEFVMQRVLKSDSTCVDIGCHLGDVLEPMLRFAPRGEFFAFEPLPKLFAHLQTRFGRDERVKLFNLALSDKEGDDVFQHVVNAPAYSGFRRTDGTRPDETVEAITVRKARLDHILDGAEIDLIKIDVEGAELQVLRGGLETIRKSKPYILFEHAGHAQYYGTKSEEIFELLQNECELNISLLDTFLRGGRPLSKTEFVGLVKSEYFFLAHGRP